MGSVNLACGPKEPRKGLLMLSVFLDKESLYDGHQLAPLRNYLVHDLLGSSIVGWVGPCDVTLDHMIDGEDLKQSAPIKADKMLHFVIEVFHQSLHAGVLLQRLMGEMVRQTLSQMGTPEKVAQLIRKGDDLYWGDKKMNVSIATSSGNSFLIHFGINVVNAGTPVETCALEDFGVKDAKAFGMQLMSTVVAEVESQVRATQKVRTF